MYTDSLPEELDGPNLEVPLAQHLLVAADQYNLVRPCPRLAVKLLCAFFRPTGLQPLVTSGAKHCETLCILTAQPG